MGGHVTHHRQQIVQFQLADQVHPRYDGHNGIIGFARGQQPQGVGRGIAQDQPPLESGLKQVVVHDSATMDRNTLSSQLFHGIDRR